ncbi:unnamed protein product [Leuciscus chuanchicus]
MGPARTSHWSPSRYLPWAQAFDPYRLGGFGWEVGLAGSSTVNADPQDASTTGYVLKIPPPDNRARVAALRPTRSNMHRQSSRNVSEDLGPVLSDLLSSSFSRRTGGLLPSSRPYRMIHESLKTCPAGGQERIIQPACKRENASVSLTFYRPCMCESVSAFMERPSASRWRFLLHWLSELISSA